MAHELASKSRIEQIKPPALEFLFDIDAPDHNGAILERLISGLEAGNSVITTRTIFRADKTKKGTRDTYISYDLIPAFKVIKNNYDIYAGGSFLVFIPKNLAKELSAEERLEKLDLKKEEMTKISLAEAWEKSLEESSVKKLRQLFSEHPKQDKVVFIAGHGGVGNPAGMSAKEYQDFLEWIKEQRCQGLLVTSCYSGGESTMLHLQKNEEGKKVQPLNLPFPVMVRSIGDFTSRGAIKAEKNVNTFFSRISELFSSPGGQTLFRLRRAIQEYEKEFGEKSTSNLMQVHFPHSADSPGGFRPVGEGGKSESLTYVKYRKKEVEEGRIVIENRDFLELFPGVVMTPVDVVKKNPVLLSLIPGNAQHLLKEVNVRDSTAKDFISKNAEFYKDTVLGVRKTFYINSLKSSHETLDQVFLDFKTGICGYREGANYFLWNVKKDEGPRKVTPLQFVLSWNKTINNSRPTPEALRAATGGQQSTEDISRSLQSEHFWGESKSTFEQFKGLLSAEKVKKMNLDILMKEISMDLSKEDQISLLTYLISHNEELAVAYFQKTNIPPDSLDERGMPLLIHAVYRQSFYFASFLLEKGCDPNLADPIGDTPLSYATMFGYEKMINLLLSQESINLKAENKMKESAFTNCIYHPEYLPKFLEKDPSLDLNISVKDPEGNVLSLLSLAVMAGKKDFAEILLKLGANPNGNGKNLNPLSGAILKDDSEFLEMLIANGADPYFINEEGNSPIKEAVRRGSVDLIERLLKIEIPKMEPEVRVRLEEEMYTLGIKSGEESKIRFFLKRKLSLPFSIGISPGTDFEKGLNLLHILGKDKLIEELISAEGRGDSKGIHQFINWSVSKAPDLLLKCMDSSWELSSIVKKVIRGCRTGTLPFETAEGIIKKAVELGVDLNEPNDDPYEPSLLSGAIDDGLIELAKIFIACGADPSLASKEIVKSGDLSLLELALEKGLSLNGAEKQPPILSYIVSSDLGHKKMREAFKWLVLKGADLNKGSLSVSPMEMVAASGDEELYHFCLTQGASIRRDTFPTLIQLAASSRSSGGGEIIKDLVSGGADLNANGPQDYLSCFAFIVQHCSFKMISWCIDQGAEVSPDNPSHKVLPVQAAAVRGDGEGSKIFKFLVEKGGNLNQIGIKKTLPVIPIITKGDGELLKFCFENGAILKSSDVVEKAFLRAVESGNPEILEVLRSYGYTCTLSKWEPPKALELLNKAYIHENFSMLKKVLSLNPPAELVQIAGSQLLSTVIKKNDLKALQLLEEKGFSPNEEMILENLGSWSGMSGFEVFVNLFGRLNKKLRAEYFRERGARNILRTKSPEIVKLALQNGLNPNSEIEDVWGERYNLIFLAIELRNTQIVQLLLEAGVDLAVKFEGKNPLEYAIREDVPEIVELLGRVLH